MCGMSARKHSQAYEDVARHVATAVIISVHHSVVFYALHVVRSSLKFM